MPRPRKIDNPNLIPRDPNKLPDFDRVTARYMPVINKICHDIKKNFYKQVNVPDIEEEIYQTVMVEYCTIWDYYKRGASDLFPPFAGYLYTCSWHKFLMQYAPTDDLYATGIHPYNTLEMPLDAGFTRNIIVRDRFYYKTATQNDLIPFREHKDDESVIFGQAPDMLDFWFLGFSIRELAVIYNLSTKTVRLRLHTLYDAVEVSGGAVFRSRPKRSKPRENRFKIKKTRK